MSDIPAYPPLMTGLATGPANPFPIACAQAERGTDSGLLAWSLSPERLRTALVLAPEVALEPAMAAFCACAVGLQNAFGVLAPPESAVHLDWSGGIRLNGGHVGGLHVAASTRDPAVVPDWMVVGLELTLALPDTLEPGQTPDWTALDQEGCAELDPVQLLEAWARHTLVWLNALDEPGGRATLHREWRGLAWNLGKPTAVTFEGSRIEGLFQGVDENFGILLKCENGTRLIPLSSLIEEH